MNMNQRDAAKKGKFLPNSTVSPWFQPFVLKDGTVKRDAQPLKSLPAEPFFRPVSYALGKQKKKRAKLRNAFKYLMLGDLLFAEKALLILNPSLMWNFLIFFRADI